jgi:hypothetical protein
VELGAVVSYNEFDCVTAVVVAFSLFLPLSPIDPRTAKAAIVAPIPRTIFAPLDRPRVAGCADLGGGGTAEGAKLSVHCLPSK